MAPDEVVTLLNDTFSLFDKLVQKHELEKIKTIGDAYMAVSGVPIRHADHARESRRRRSTCSPRSRAPMPNAIDRSTCGSD
jgi:class 3 adenylate cyclase